MNLSRRDAVVGLLAAGLMPSAGVAQEGTRALTDAYNASGQDLFRSFAAAPGNIVFSPYSIGTAMAMVLAGARGDTEREMAGVLRHRQARQEIADANARALAVLNGYDQSNALPLCPWDMHLAGGRCEMPRAVDERCPPRAGSDEAFCFAIPQPLPSAKVAVANALMLTRKDAPVSADYVALLKAKFAAELFQGASLAEINGFVASRTEGKIERILDQLDDSVAAVLLNAIYFKTAWASTFSKQETRDEPFSLMASQPVSVPMMHKRANVPLVTRAGYRAVRLPYVIGAIGMVVVLPDVVDGLVAIGASLDVSALVAALNASEPKAVSLALPRFKLSFKADLVPPLRAAGMTLAFDPMRADFSGMIGPAGRGRFAIGQIAHRAVIEVQEEGTEAAAATAAMMALTSAPSNQATFRVDRPFLYYVVDDATGAILFQGRVVDPR
jgi:leukocyte elastase inhibitor